MTRQRRLGHEGAVAVERLARKGYWRTHIILRCPAHRGQPLCAQNPVGHCFEKPWKVIGRKLSHFSAKRLISNMVGIPLGSASKSNTYFAIGAS